MKYNFRSTLRPDRGVSRLPITNLDVSMFHLKALSKPIKILFTYLPANDIR
jgi:hypothetical protein